MTVGNQALGYGPQDIAHDETSATHKSMKLDFAILLKDFEIAYHTTDSIHPDRIPESYTSHVTIFSEAEQVDTVIKVNEPVNVNGWDIYQYGYGGIVDDTTVGFSRLLLVRDPWLPFVYTGIFIMLGGALTLIFIKTPNHGKA